MSSDKSFRVLLDLNDLQINSLKYVWINVSPSELLTIADFKSSILRKINLESTNIKLYVCKGLLLDSETITILRENDTVKVHYDNQSITKENTLENFAKEKRKSSRKRIYAECVDDSSIISNEFRKSSKTFDNINDQSEIDIKQKKKKSKQLHPLEPENSCSQSIALEDNNLQKLETHKKKDKRLKTSEKNKSDIQIGEFFSFNDSECTVLGNKRKSTENTCMEISDISKTNLSKETSSIDNVNIVEQNELKDQSSLQTVTVEDSNVLNNTTSKKKRKRHRKRKKVNETVSDITENNQSEFKSFVYEASKTYEGKHVKYSSPSKDEVIEIDCNDSCQSIKTPKAETFVLNGSTSNCTVESSYNHPKVSTPAQSNKIENPNWCLSGMQNTTINSPVKIYEKNLGLSTTNSIPNNFWNSTRTKSYSRQSEEFKTKGNQSEKTGLEEINLSYSQLPPLNSRPDIGTRLAYKILELDEHYSPVISDYREGIVKSINYDNEEMEIELLKHMIKPARTGKFENLCEGEVLLPEIKKYDIVRWSSLVEPKLLC